MTTTDKQIVLDLINANQGSPIKIQFGYVKPDSSVDHDALVLLKANAGFINDLVTFGFSLYMVENSGLHITKI